MFCTNCGKEVHTGKAFCTDCGAALTPGQVTQATQATEQMATQQAAETTEQLATQQAAETTEPTLVVPAQPPVAPPQPEVAVAPVAGEAPTQPVQVIQPAPSAGSPQPPSKHYGRYAFIAGLVLVICIGAAVAAYLLLRDDGGASSTASTAPDGTIILDVEIPGEGSTVDLVDLSARAASMSASSVLESQGDVDYEVDNLIDKKPATCWAEGVTGYGIGESVEFTWASPVDVYQVRILPGYDKSAGGWDRWTSNGRVRTFDLVFSDGTTESFQVTDNRAMQSLDLGATHTVTTVRFVITGVYEAAPGPHKAEDTSMSELHLWGTE